MSTKDEARDQPLASASAVSSPAHQLDEFCAHVLADVSLHDKLRRPDDADQFIALVLDTARQWGFDFGGEQVAAAMQDRLPTAEGRDVPRQTALPPAGWLPIRASWQRGELYVAWAYFGERRLSAPFFAGDVHRAQHKPFNRLFRYVTPIAGLADWLQAHPGLRPSGFIFHMSRCGSTLVARMLASLPQNIVISEADPIDTVVRADRVRPGLSLDRQAQWLTWMILGLGANRNDQAQNYVVKLDCWHTLALPLFRRAFPDVPWVFLYRDPVEVLVSHRSMPGMQMIPGLLAPDLFDPTDGLRDPDDYRARVLARICEPVLRQYSEAQALLVNYKDLPQGLWTTIMPFFGLACSDSDRAQMAAAARYDAKTPAFEFTPDTASKQRIATAAVRSAADKWLGAPYRQLEALRLGS